MHGFCDRKGPLLVLVFTTDGHKFGAYAAKEWESIGGWRQSRKSFLFGLDDGKGRLPFQCKIINSHEKPSSEPHLTALFFSSKYGLVFGKTDLKLNFDDMR